MIKFLFLFKNFKMDKNFYYIILVKYFNLVLVDHNKLVNFPRKWTRKRTWKERENERETTRKKRMRERVEKQDAQKEGKGAGSKERAQEGHRGRGKNTKLKR